MSELDLPAKTVHNQRHWKPLREKNCYHSISRYLQYFLKKPLRRTAAEPFFRWLTRESCLIHRPGTYWHVVLRSRKPKFGLKNSKYLRNHLEMKLVRYVETRQCLLNQNKRHVNSVKMNYGNRIRSQNKNCNHFRQSTKWNNKINISVSVSTCRFTG